MKITQDIKYVGVNDKKIDLFEGQYIVPKGMSYNSYVILDEKIAVMDSVDIGFDKEWLENIKKVLGDKSPDYLVVQHMEPDHSSSILSFTKAYPDAKIVASSLAFRIMKNYFSTDFTEKRIVVSEGDTLNLGRHTLKFIIAPMVHWPEVIMTYDSYDKVLFSADAFGKFGSLDTEEDWTDEARRYYIGIVGKFGVQVQALLEKAKGLEIEKICSLHGPILEENLDYYINLYDLWSSYTPEEEGIVINYTSVYGNTKRAVFELVQMLKNRGYEKVTVNDLARCDMAKAVGDSFKYSKTVLATTTYNGDIFPFMREFIENLKERNFTNRTVALIENGSWSPLAGKVMKGMLSEFKNIDLCITTPKILSVLNEDSLKALETLANELIK
ncbi:MAG: FprA family A-type flavoprotein [Ruminococcaceae bacterium]|nr:FprA family A-type flavoprotein [Oscillospiraceae bacterium]